MSVWKYYVHTVFFSYLRPACQGHPWLSGYVCWLLSHRVSHSWKFCGPSAVLVLWVWAGTIYSPLVASYVLWYRLQDYCQGWGEYSGKSATSQLNILFFFGQGAVMSVHYIFWCCVFDIDEFWCWCLVGTSVLLIHVLLELFMVVFVYSGFGQLCGRCGFLLILENNSRLYF